MIVGIRPNLWPKMLTEKWNGNPHTLESCFWIHHELNKIAQYVDGGSSLNSMNGGDGCSIMPIWGVC